MSEQETEHSVLAHKYNDLAECPTCQRTARNESLRHLASAMKKLLPPELLAEVISYLAPEIRLLAALREPESADAVGQPTENPI